MKAELAEAGNQVTGGSGKRVHKYVFDSFSNSPKIYFRRGDGALVYAALTDGSWGFWQCSEIPDDHDDELDDDIWQHVPEVFAATNERELSLESRFNLFRRNKQNPEDDLCGHYEDPRGWDYGYMTVERSADGYLVIHEKDRWRIQIKTRDHLFCWMGTGLGNKTGEPKLRWRTNIAGTCISWVMRGSMHVLMENDTPLRCQHEVDNDFSARLGDCIDEALREAEL